MITRKNIIQALIILFSGGAITFITQGGSWLFWGFVIGLAGQPLWLYTSWKNKQHGIFLVALYYTYRYLYGVWKLF